MIERSAKRAQRNTAGLFLRYVAVGASLNLLAVLVVISLQAMGFEYRMAFLIQVVFCSFLSCYLQRFFAFMDRGALIRSLMLYGLLYASSYLLQIVIYPVFRDYLHMPDALAVLFTVGVAAVYSFVILSVIVFKPSSPTKS